MDSKLKAKQELTGFIVSAAITAVIFLATITFIYPVDFNELAGYHNWLNGSTIKFVNEWLEEGASNLNFTMYEYPEAIERAGMDREPYVSYPNGTIVTVWALAKITGRQHIGIGFLKGVACMFYYMDSMLFAGFVYLFLSAFKIKDPVTKTLIASAAAACWIWQPVNIYYLANIFFADQYVTFWILGFLLIEFLDITDHKLWKKIVKAVIIYCGCMVDYYFWIMTALAWGLDLIALIIRKSKIKEHIKSLALYASPAMLAVLSFYLQISHIDNWYGLLMERFKLRVSNEGEEGVSSSGITGILKFFKQAYCDDSKKRAILIALFILITVALAIYYLVREKKLKDVFTDSKLRILLLGSIAPATQILVLKNHSGVHEFSMIKLSWPMVMAAVVFGLLALWLRGRHLDEVSSLKGIRNMAVPRVFTATVCSLALMMLLGGHPTSPGYYKNARDFDIDYSLEYAMYDNLDKDDVCFSFTRQIVVNGPQRISITGKLLYRVGSTDEIDTLFPNLPENARKILIIDRDFTAKGSKIDDMQTEILSRPGSKIIYYDDRYIFAEIGG